MKRSNNKPSELLQLQKKTGQSYWDLIDRPLYAANTANDFDNMLAAYNCGKSMHKYGGGKNKKSGTWDGWYGSLNAKQKSALDQQIQFFRDNGFDDISIAGIIGNSVQESSLNPNAVSDTGAYHGYYQMSKDMKAAVKKAYGDFSPESQMRFLNDMFSGNSKAIGRQWVSYGKDYKKNSYKDVKSSTEAFRRYFERNLHGYEPNRERYANYVYSYMNSNPTQPAGQVQQISAPDMRYYGGDIYQENLNNVGRQDNTRVVMSPSEFTKSIPPGYLQKKAAANGVIDRMIINPIEQEIERIQNPANIWSGNLLGYNSGKSYPFNFWNRNPYTLKPVIR